MAKRIPANVRADMDFDVGPMPKRSTAMPRFQGPPTRAKGTPVARGKATAPGQLKKALKPETISFKPTVPAPPRTGIGVNPGGQTLPKTASRIPRSIAGSAPGPGVPLPPRTVTPLPIMDSLPLRTTSQPIGVKKRPKAK